MVAVFVHQVVGVPFELLPELPHDLIHVLLCEVRGAQNDGLPAEAAGHQDRFLQRHRSPAGTRRSLEFERLSELSGVARVDFEDAAEGVRVAPVRKL